MERRAGRGAYRVAARSPAVLRFLPRVKRIDYVIESHSFAALRLSRRCSEINDVHEILLELVDAMPPTFRWCY
jgi:hypothetical protein